MMDCLILLTSSPILLQIAYIRACLKAKITLYNIYYFYISRYFTWFVTTQSFQNHQTLGQFFNPLYQHNSVPMLFYFSKMLLNVVILLDFCICKFAYKLILCLVFTSLINCIQIYLHFFCSLASCNVVLLASFNMIVHHFHI